ncbi:MAG: c-type cytochrome [Burkholderiaceae bacterium]
MTRIVAALAAFVAAVALGALAFVWSGRYDISANVQHTQLVYTLLETTMHQSVKLRASGIEVPALESPTTVARGAACYVAKCVQCHGGPGAAQAEIGRSMQPLPGPLVDASAKWRPSELYWITRNGIKMSGMPAWQHRLPDADLWALVAFMQRLPTLTAAEFQKLSDSGAAAQCAVPAEQVLRAPSIERGRAAITQYACNACHNVPGITGSDVHVGPPLAGIAARKLIAGSLANTPEQMVRWLRDPRSIDPETAMPAMQVSEQDARDIAAFLATLH